MVKYSFCITCYNSKDIVDDFIEPLLNLKDDYEIIIVDGGSKDGTYEKFKKYEKDNIKILRENCSIGKGRDIALKASQGEIIITLDFDVRIEKPLMIVENFNKLNIDKIIRFSIKNSQCTNTIYVGKRDLFLKVGGFPHLVAADDVYFDKKLKKLNIIEFKEIDLPHKCLYINNKSSGITSRYEKNILKKIKRRILVTRDNIFVQNLNFKDFIKFYKLTGYKIYVIGIPLYLIGKFLSYFVKIPKLD